MYITSNAGDKFVSFESLGQSLGGVEIPLIKFKNHDEDSLITRKKPVIVIIGRQHSGETHSSFIIHGLMNTLSSVNVLANKFREEYETWVIPMINPDGVLAGNYRCNLQGKDMNRHFFSDTDPSAKGNRAYEVELFRDLLSTTFGKNLDGRLKMFIDIHAHST